MRWEALFSDLEAQLAAADAAEFDAEVADRTRREIARLRLADRWRAAAGTTISVRVRGVGLVAGRLSGSGPDWILLDGAAGREELVAATAVLAISGLGRTSATPGSEGAVAARLDLRHALRGLIRDRAPVTIVLDDGTTCAGTPDRVGADFVEVAEHAASEVRRAGSVRGVLAVPIAALAVVRRS